MIKTKDLHNEILERLKTEELVRIPASEEDYLQLATKVPFKIEYHESEIYTMGLASLYHELITATIITILNNLFANQNEIMVLGSNSGVQIPKFEGGYYMPDVVVVKGAPNFKANSNSIFTNPYIIVEVLSKATASFDLEAKLPEYKHLSSLQQIIYINPKRVEVSTYTRTEAANTWINKDFYELSDSIVIDGNPVLLDAIYKKVVFNS
jgi:Uma2 family endonuclease